MTGVRRTGGTGHAGGLADAMPPARSRPLRGTALCMALVALAIVLGGGGTVNPQTEMVLQCLTALIIIPLIASANWQRGLGPVHGGAWLLAGLVLLMPVAQLIPLPPSIWQSLPGRAVEVQSLATAGAAQSWMPLTMAPARTFASLLAMICPVLLMLQVSRLSLRGRNWICGIVVVSGFLSLVVGLLQLSHTGGWSWSLYSQFSEGSLVGFQANRNAEADILLVALLAFGALVTVRLADGRHHVITWAGLAMGVLMFVVGVLMTGSRTGIALIAIALVCLAAMLWPALRRRRSALRWLGIVLASAVLSGLFAWQSPMVRKIILRFSSTREARWDLWADTWYAIHQVWPFGSGIGTIVPMLEAAERLDVVDTTRPVRAHNDWLEWLLEGGLPGVLVLGAISLVVLAFAVRALMSASRRGAAPGRRAQVFFAVGLIFIEALHAIVDYPMRSMSLAALTAVAVAFLLEPAAAQRNKS